MSSLFKHYCGIKRDVAEGTNGRTKKATLSVANKCVFIPMPAPMEIQNGFTIGSGYDCYFKSTDQDVQMGDQLVWNNKTFNVRAVNRYEVPTIGHVACLVTREGI